MKFEQMVSKELVIKYLTGESTEAETLLINQWLNEKAENKRYFDEIEFLWRAAGISREISEEVKRDDWNNILGRIEKTAEYSLLESGDKQRGSIRISSITSREILNKFLKIAALFLLAFSFSWATFYFLNKRPDTGSLAYNRIITSKGQKSQIILSDGTKVWLNSETELKYPAAFTGKQREVFLEGEAFFEVKKKDKRITFVVKTTDIDVKVLGTCFNVMAYSDESTVETTVVEGSVSVIRKGSKPSQDRSVILKPNQKVTLLKKGSQLILTEIETDKPALVKSEVSAQSASSAEKDQILVSSKVDIELHTAWKEDRLVFRSETLENIAYKLERWYDVNIHIQDEELMNYRYTGEFAHKETLTQVLEILYLTTPITYTFKQNDVYIEKGSE